MIGVVHVKNIVSDMDEELFDINSEIQNEEQIIYDLNTKWAILTRPQRISKRAKALLDMQEPDFKKLSNLNSIPMRKRSSFDLMQSVN